MANQIKKRFISDHDAQILTGVGSAFLKAGFTMATLVGTNPETAVAVAVAYELTGVILESQRQRLSEFAGHFAKRTSEIPEAQQNTIKERLKSETGNRIFETAWRQAAEEVDPEKLDMIARLLKNSLSAKVLDEFQVRWLLKLLDELDIVQIVILQSFSQKHGENPEFKQEHLNIFEHANLPEYPQFVPSRQYSRFVAYYVPQTDEDKATAARERPQFQRELEDFNRKLPMLEEEYEIALERHALYRSRIDSLVDRGVLGAARSSQGHFTDDPDLVSEGLTPLGAALLKIIDSISPSEWGKASQINAVQAVQQSLIDIKSEHEKISNSLLGR